MLLKLNPEHPEESKIRYIAECLNDDLSHLSDFTKPVDTSIYKIMSKALPGPFTFILHASSEIPKIFRSRKKTIGIRVPDNNICREIIKEVGSPLMNTSLHHEEDEI